VDLNNDGYRDILSGSYSRTEGSMAGLFYVLWGEAGGKFKEAAALKGTDGEPLILPGGQTDKICTRPTAVDWNGDGKLDLVVGNFSGGFFWFTGEAGGKFAPKAERLMAGNSQLQIKGMHGDPFVVDWEGDGDLDLLSGTSEGAVQWAENTAGRGKVPALKEFATVIEPGPSFEFGHLLKETDLKRPVGSARVWVEDVNGDGKLDVLVGDRVTLVSIAKGVSEKKYKQRVQAWKTTFDAAVKKSSEAKDDKQREAAQKEISELFQERAEFMKEESTGYVWLYKQKADGRRAAF
jgi:hypothetical protein